MFLPAGKGTLQIAPNPGKSGGFLTYSYSRHLNKQDSGNNNWRLCMIYVGKINCLDGKVNRHQSRI